MRAELSPSVKLDLKSLQRYSYASSSCGVCGKASIEALAQLQRGSFSRPEPATCDPEMIKDLPARLREAQTVFRHTGGIHATGLFDLEGYLLLMREDVGRHNALDKVIGAKFLKGELPISATIGFCSGRLGFELVQKSLRAGLPILAAVGAPSVRTRDKCCSMPLARRLHMPPGYSWVAMVRKRPVLARGMLATAAIGHC